MAKLWSSECSQTIGTERYPGLERAESIVTLHKPKGVKEKSDKGVPEAESAVERAT